MKFLNIVIPSSLFLLSSSRAFTLHQPTASRNQLGERKSPQGTFLGHQSINQNHMTKMSQSECEPCEGSDNKKYTEVCNAYLSDLFGLKNKVAIVTGSTSGIGYAIAEGLLRSGAKVVLNGRNEEKASKARDRLYEELGINSGILIVVGDMSAGENAQKIVDDTMEHFGQLDIIVNNAGINLKEQPFQCFTADDWEKIAAVNMRGPINLTRAALPHLRNAKAGRIINLSSIGGSVGLAKNTLYTMTKGAILLFTKSLASELATTHITVNSISPGVMATPMNAKYAPGTEEYDNIVSNIPMARMGDPKELVGAVIYLASRAGGYNTGSDILVDGGYSAV